MFSSPVFSKVSLNSKYGRPTMVAPWDSLSKTPTPSKRSFLPFFRIASSGSSSALAFESPCPTRAHHCWSCQSSVWNVGAHAHWNHGGCVVLALGQSPGYWIQLLRVQGRSLDRRAAVGAFGHTVSGIHLQRTEFEGQ